VRLLVSVDTEGDNLWAKPRSVSTENAAYLPRFQAMCEAYGLTPTYFTNYEMAISPVFRELGRDVLARGKGEIGMHLHAWNSPPLLALTRDDLAHQPYLIEYPESVLREKVHAMTALLEETFDRKMVAHRAGRWALSPAYARSLVDEGYRVDSSVTPHVSWASSKGDPLGCGGVDYSAFPENPYYMDLTHLSKAGHSPLLEVPMTTAPRAARFGRFSARSHLLSRLVSHAPPLWLRPRGNNLGDMRFLVERALREGRSHVQLMIHSSELMPGGSPRFRDARAVSGLYADVVALLERFKGRFRGSTFAELREVYAETMPPAGSAARA
jgi:hypothetical protein